MSFLTYREKEERAYPSSDGKPFAENDLIFDYMAYSLETLKFYFKNCLDVYVSANSFVYYEEGNKKAVVAPDVYVVCFSTLSRNSDKQCRQPNLLLNKVIYCNIFIILYADRRIVS